MGKLQSQQRTYNHKTTTRNSTKRDLQLTTFHNHAITPLQTATTNK